MDRMVLEVETHRRSEMIDVTALVQQALSRRPARSGAATLFVPHTTAGITINEHADPDVAADMIRFFDALVPRRADYAHAEGNADAHIKASLVGNSVRVPIERGRLCLGRWQGIFFCEFDGPRRRELWVMLESPAESPAGSG